MVGPHPFVRSSSLFSKRFIAICLLVLYGAPAAIGPHWHQHGHSCSHGDASCHSDISSSVEVISSSSCGCSHVGEVSAEGEVPNSPAEPGMVASHGACAVCAFYSQAQSEFWFAPQVCSGQLVESARFLSFSGEFTRTVFLQARGPPC